MKTSLKDLKKNGGAKKVYSFLKPLTEILKENYTDIYEKFNSSNLVEAMAELKKDGKIKTLAVYVSPEEIRLTDSYSIGNASVKKGEKLEDLSFEKKFEVYLSRISTLPLYFGGSTYNRYKPDYDCTIDEVYVVVDRAAAEEECLNIMIAEEAVEVKRRAEAAEKDRKELVENNKTKAKYGIEKMNARSKVMVEFLESLNGSDNKAKFEALDCLLDEVNDCDCW